MYSNHKLDYPFYYYLNIEILVIKANKEGIENTVYPNI